jgi:tRNA threonylcarbamoyladenosine modification (KEOPS) complex Cgi121 subunit
MRWQDYMQPEDETLVKGLRAWTVTVDRGSAPALTRRLAESSAEGHVLVVKAEMVFGLDHLRSALHHAARATRDGRNASDSLAMETLLYASGERQLSAAIKKMSPDETTEQIVVASLHEDALEPMPDWDRLPQRPGKDALDRLAKFGISGREVETVGEADATELVLERVALVDVLKK